MTSADPHLESEVCLWIEAITDTQQGSLSAHEWLRDGKVLCAVINKLKPQAKVKANKMAKPFMMRENITMFLRAIRKEFPRVKEGDMFSTDDLYDAKDMSQVFKFIYSFGGVVQLDPECSHFPGLGVPQKASTRLDVRVNKDLGSVDLNSGYSKSQIVDKPTVFVGGRPANVVNESAYDHTVSSNSINSSFKAVNNSIKSNPRSPKASKVNVNASIKSNYNDAEAVVSSFKANNSVNANNLANASIKSEYNNAEAVIDDDEDSAAEEVLDEKPGVTGGYSQREKNAYAGETPSAYPPSP